MCLYKVDCFIYETNTTLRINYTSIFFLKNMDPWQDMKGSRKQAVDLEGGMRNRESRRRGEVIQKREGER